MYDSLSSYPFECMHYIIDALLRQWLLLLLIFLPFSSIQAMDVLKLSINKRAFHVEVPVTQQEYQHGLMLRYSLDQQHGMIFFFEPDANKPAMMWMKNTYVPLDLLFVGADYKIACIIERAQPLSLHVLSCQYPVAAVIELNAGEAKAAHLVLGMNIEEVE